MFVEQVVVVDDAMLHANTCTSFLVLTVILFNTFADALQEGEVWHSGLTAIVCVRHFLSHSVRSTEDPGALMESGMSVGASSLKLTSTSGKSF